MTKDKIYEYDGKYYSNTDHSLEVADGEWGGDLFDLYFNYSHSKEGSGVLGEETVYYNAYNPGVTYCDCDELVEDFFADDEVDLEQIKEVHDD